MTCERESLRARRAQNAAVTLLLVMIATTATLVYLLFLEEPFLSYRNLPFPALEPDVQQGRPIPLRVVRCNSTDRQQTYTITRSLQSLDTAEYVVLPESVVQLAPGCTESISLANRVPLEVKPGSYRVIGVADVRGTLRTHRVEWYSLPFRVIERREAAWP